MKIYIISGFLGAGKTTFIKEFYTRNPFKKIAIIENDFGDVSVDATILKTENIFVSEINSGCVCCTLKGDLIRAIAEIKKTYNPDILLIEPSGVSKLSEMLEIVSKNNNDDVIAVTIIDVERASLYYQNFGDFYENQIMFADYLFLNRKSNPEQVVEVKELITTLNPTATIIEEEFADEIFLDFINQEEWQAFHSDHHHADEHFQTLTYRIQQSLTKQMLNAIQIQLYDVAFESIVRLKGVVDVAGQKMLLQYVSGDFQVTPIDSEELSLITIIGNNLSKTKIEQILLKGLI